ncbi:hypothetical protein [Parasitella parasitica]|uniref:Core-binding (CB) domain-containing protein n=1 Tax=Parasitella parasitica TaxID=35722 RepID=A0A0B7NCT7_9FUNG|nr:hypothetical protein [Parasitella parasitica]
MRPTDPVGQHDLRELPAQTGGNTVVAIDATGDGHLENVPSTGHHITSSAHCRDPEYQGGSSVAGSPRPPRLHAPALHLPRAPGSLGRKRRRSLCGPPNSPAAKVRRTEGRAVQLCDGRIHDPMGPVFASVPEPTMAAGASVSPEHSQGTDPDGDTGGTPLAKRDLVPVAGVDELDGSQDVDSTTDGDLAGLRRSITLNNPELEAPAVDLILHKRLQPSASNRTTQRYQYLFLLWTTTTGVDLNRFSVSDLINFLTAMFRDKGYMVSTLRTIKAAALQFHVNAAQFACNPNLILLFKSLAAQEPPILIHRPTIELTPTFRAVRAIPSATTTPIAQLQRKMSFLLAMTCFLRPSDVQRIDRASMTCQDTESPNFRVVAPKETRGHRRIIKPFHVCAHADPLLCPVLAHVSVRLLASSLALKNGVPYDQVVTQGNWVLSITFEQHYRRDQLATHDFSAAVLSYNGDPITVDQVLEDP